MTCNGTTPVKIKTLHGIIDIYMQRFKEKGKDGEMSYFDLTEQFQDGYISNRLKELSAY